MFKYPPEDEIVSGSDRVPVEVKFIDFQSARYSSLVTDILSFAFTSMSSNIRRHHINDLLEVSSLFNIHYVVSVSRCYKFI